MSDWPDGRLRMIPGRNNVYGEIIGPRGLKPVLKAIERLMGSGRASIYRSRFDGAETLQFSSDEVDIESTPLEGERHLLTGGVGGSLEDVIGFVRTLSGTLAEPGIDHRFEVYDDERQLAQIIPP